jgi:hypothetical protein
MDDSWPEFETVRDDLMPLLCARCDRTTKPMIYHDLNTGVVFPTPSGYTRVDQQLLDYWGTTLGVVLEIANWNLRRNTHDADWSEIATVPGLFSYTSTDGLASSRLLCLQDLARPWPLEGVLAVVPTRGQLLVLPMNNLDILQNMRIMVLAGDTGRENGTHPISDQLFWFDGERWETIVVGHTQTDIEIYPSQRFMDALERITAIHLVPVAAEA